MESWVGTAPEEISQVAVAHLVLGVSHLMVHSDEIVLGHSGTLLDTEITGDKNKKMKEIMKITLHLTIKL